MSESESQIAELQETSDTQLFSTEYKDGQLQIVEVTPFDKGDRTTLQVSSSEMPVLEADSDGTKYVQVVASDKSIMQLDLLNLTLVRCEDGVESYRLLSNGEAGDSSSEATVTCVLHSSDNEEGGESYVMMDGTQGPLVLLQAAPAPPCEEPTQPPKLSPAEILEKAKALQKAKQQIIQSQLPVPGKAKRGRKRKSDLPPPHELLSSPNFKLFLYSCKMCSFKCNAIKEMTAHKAAEHCERARAAAAGEGAGRPRRGAAPSALQCAVCPYRAGTHYQLLTHTKEMHPERMYKNRVSLSTAEVEAADVLVCGACGYESSSRSLFRAHIECVHGATAC